MKKSRSLVLGPITSKTSVMASFGWRSMGFTRRTLTWASGRRPISQMGSRCRSPRYFTLLSKLL